MKHKQRFMLKCGAWGAGVMLIVWSIAILLDWSNATPMYGTEIWPFTLFVLAPIQGAVYGVLFANLRLLCGDERQ